jgi:tripartite-type tricarboxylate transporter receptor subunit TctC
VKLPRRKFLGLAAGAAALPALPRIGRAQAFPSRPVRLILGYGPGGSPDIVARLVSQRLSERLGQPIVIENRPGAGSNIGTEAVVKAPADGYTLLYVTTANAINASLYARLNFNFIRDVAPIAGLIHVPNLVSTTPSLPVTTIAELIAYAKANPGKLNFGSPGGAVQLAGELFKMMAGVDIVHVPYTNQTQAVTDLVAGRMQISFDLMPLTIEFVKTGKARGLAVATKARSAALPEIPTVAETVAGYESSAWHGIGAPKGTSSEIIENLNREINACLADPTIRTRLAELGAETIVGSPGDFGNLIVEETDKWAKVVTFAGIKPE